MSSDIDDLLAEIRDPDNAGSLRPHRTSLAMVTGAIGLASVLISAGLLAFGAVATLASPHPIAQNQAVASPPGITSTATAIDTATLAPAPVAPAPAGSADASMPVFDVNSDISTIVIPGSFDAKQAENAKIRLFEQALEAKCMAEKGFHYTYTPDWMQPLTRGADLPSWDSPFGEALWGMPDRPVGDDYDWQQAGCNGYAVHAADQDAGNY